MSKFPVVKVKALQKILSSLGFYPAKQKSTSHLIYKHSDGRRTTLSVHGNKEIPLGTLHAIIRDLDITKDQFLELIEDIM